MLILYMGMVHFSYIGLQCYDGRTPHLRTPEIYSIAEKAKNTFWLSYL